MARANLRQRRLDRGRVQRFGAQAQQTQQDRAIDAVAPTRQRQRAVELNTNPGSPLQLLPRDQFIDKTPRRIHRAHRV